MRIALLINRVLLTLLSISTGLVKIAQMPEEMAIFREVGFSDGATIAFGVLQLVGGLLLLPSRSSRIGAWVMLPTFALATGVLFLNGMVPFGLFSLLFLASAAAHGLYGPGSKLGSGRGAGAGLPGGSGSPDERGPQRAGHDPAP